MAISPVLFVPTVPSLAAPCKPSWQSPQYYLFLTAISPVLFVPTVPLLAAPDKLLWQSPQYSLFLTSPCLLHHTSSLQSPQYSLFLTSPCLLHHASFRGNLPIIYSYRPLACCTTQAFVAISPVLFVPNVPLLAAPCKLSWQSPQYYLFLSPPLFLTSPRLLHHASFRGNLPSILCS